MAEDPGKAKVGELVKAIDNGEYVIPHFQRGYEWQPSMVSDLFVSIIQDYFTGLLLFWELSDDRIDNEVWDSVWGAPPTDSPSWAVLDGQQRLASLYHAICHPHTEFPNRKTYYTWYLSLDKLLNEQYEEAVYYRYSFNYHTIEELRDRKDEWIEKGVVPLALLSDSQYLASPEFEDWLQRYVLDRRESGTIPANIAALRVSNLIRGILEYEFVTTTLAQGRNIHDICNIFARINQKGMRLSTFDLMNAFLFPHGIELRKRWEDLDNRELKDVDRSMHEYLLKLISLYKQGYCSSKYIYNLIPEEKDDLVETGDEFLELWREARQYAEESRKIIMNVGAHSFGAIKSKFIPNTTIVPVLGAVLWERDEYEQCVGFKETLDRWYWSATLSGDYGRSSNTMMSEDFRDWRDWFKEGSQLRRTSRLTKEFIESELDLRGSTRGAQYNAVLCMLALNGAKDFFRDWQLGTGDFVEEKINDHHIFPSKVEDLAPEKSKHFEECRDSILNRTLLLDETNKNKIRNKRPSVYLTELLESDAIDSRGELEELMKDHFISSEALECLFDDDFDGFIAEREITLKKHMLTLL